MAVRFADVDMGTYSVSSTDELDEARIVRVAYQAGGQRTVTVAYNTYGDPAVELTVVGMPDDGLLDAVRAAYDQAA